MKKTIKRTTKRSVHNDTINHKVPSQRSTHPAILQRQDISINYARTLDKLQQELPTANRRFSKAIHAKGIESIIDILASTIARPNAILIGAICAFISTVGMYLLAKYYGYHLSGAETITGFVIGWVLGHIFDYMKLLMAGKNS